MSSIFSSGLQGSGSGSGLSGFGSIKVGELLISCTLGIGMALILDRILPWQKRLKELETKYEIMLSERMELITRLTTELARRRELIEHQNKMMEELQAEIKRLNKNFENKDNQT
jgi:seryl-tRNA synthetase